MTYVPATKSRPSALDGFERAKDDEPIFTLQGGDPLGVEHTKLYIDARRLRAIHMEEGRERDAELSRCTEADRQLWAMQAYLRGERRKKVEVVEKSDDTPEAIDLFDYRVRAGQRVTEMAGDLAQISEELIRRKFASPDDDTLIAEIARLTSHLRAVKAVIEPRRLFQKDAPK